MNPFGWFIAGYIAKDFLGSDEKKEKFKLKDKIENKGFLFCDEPDEIDDDDDDEEEEDDED